MLEILAGAVMAAVAGMACWGIITIVERTAPKEDAAPQAAAAAEGPEQALLPPPEHKFIVSVTQYIRTGELVNIRFTLPEPGSWDTLEQSDAWQRFRQAVKEVQKGGPTP